MGEVPQMLMSQPGVNIIFLTQVTELLRRMGRVERQLCCSLQDIL